MSPWLEMVVRLFVASALGAAIGYERERAGKPAGLRDHVLITLGAGLFGITSIYGFEGSFDPSRVAAGVVAGVGFIGAGVIFREPRSDGVTGLTTAAAIWTAAAVGLAAGSGLYLVAVITTAIALGILEFPKIRE